MKYMKYLSGRNLIIVAILLSIYIVVYLGTGGEDSMELNWATQYVDPEGVYDQSFCLLNINGDITPSEIYTLQSWVANNIEYVETAQPQYPTETLQRGTGNCFDQTLLLYSMILNDDNDSSYILLVDAWADGTKYAHCVVLTVFDGSIIISDTTIEGINDICVLSSPEDAISNIVDGTTCTAYVPTTVISMTEYHEFRNIMDFYSFTGGN